MNLPKFGYQLRFSVAKGGGVGEKFKIFINF